VLVVLLPELNEPVELEEPVAELEELVPELELDVPVLQTQTWPGALEAVPLALLMMLAIAFIWLPILCSEAFPASIYSTVSATEIAPEML
jgi:hypothetical protein